MSACPREIKKQLTQPRMWSPNDEAGPGMAFTVEEEQLVIILLCTSMGQNLILPKRNPRPALEPCCYTTKLNACQQVPRCQNTLCMQLSQVQIGCNQRQDEYSYFTYPKKLSTGTYSPYNCSTAHSVRNSVIGKPFTAKPRKTGFDTQRHSGQRQSEIRSTSPEHCHILTSGEVQYILHTPNNEEHPLGLLFHIQTTVTIL